MSCEGCGTLRLETDAACGYHRAGSSDFEPSKLGPEGLQLEIYYALYPLAFAAVYGGAMNGGRALVGAPRGEHTSFVLERRPVSLWVRFKNLVKDLIRFVRPWAKEVCNIDMVPNQTFRDEAANDRYRFNLNGKLDYICPAAFSSIFPHVFYELENGQSCRNKVVGCPDHLVNQQFQFLSDGPEGELENCGCYDFSDLELSLGDGEAPRRRLMELVAESGVKCFTAYQVMIPYLLTLAHGGHLTFYTDDDHSAIAQCPSAKNRVQFRVARDDEDGTLYHEVVAVAGQCPRGYRTGDRAPIRQLESISPYLLYITYLYAVYLLRADPESRITFRDPLQGNGRRFELGRAKSPAAEPHAVRRRLHVRYG